MELREVGLNWDELANQDPLFPILTDPCHRDNRWDPKEFFETGRTQIRNGMAEIGQFGVQVPRGGALDFGCGVGGLRQALCEHFEHTCGLDIAPSMLAHSKRYNRHGTRCQYCLNQADNL